ncbi:SIS domain-containing protein [Anaerocolumna aminovalerica]|uniref:SIS domain-containing protein n=1 Tax=Anaerocolumna aminovalerica TaxID=1527 RepID=UPI000BE2631E|nr:hypothetical protein [Anaerocolumna aminovalerica]
MESNANIIKYWRRQPEILRKMLNDSKRLTEKFVTLFSKIRPTHLYLIGSGTSLNAEEASAFFFKDMLNLDVVTMASSCVSKIRGEKPFIIFLSQGGASTNTLQAMELLQDIPYITVTGEEVCEIASRSKNHMTIGCGEEPVGPKTIGYTASIMILYLMALETANALGYIKEHEYEEIMKNLYAGIDYMEYNMGHARSWIDENKEDMMEINNYLLIGHGVSAISLKEGCLKILETIKCPALSFEFEEYLHGPILSVNDTTGGFLFIAGEGESRERFLKLAECQKKYSKNTYVITDNEKEVIEKTLLIKRTGKAYTEVFETVIVPQLIAATIQALLEIEDGSAIYDEYTAMCPTKYNNGK